VFVPGDNTSCEQRRLLTVSSMLYEISHIANYRRISRFAFHRLFQKWQHGVGHFGGVWVGHKFRGCFHSSQRFGSSGVAISGASQLVEG